MPRKRKTNLPAIPFPGAQYGQGQQQIAAQQAMPLPNVVNAQQNMLDAAAQGGGPPALPPGAPAPGAPGPPAMPPPPQGPTNFQGALDEATAEPPGSALDNFSGQDHITAGMDMGPGPGSEVLDLPNQANVFRVLADTSGDPNYLRLAMMAKMGTQ